MRHIKVMRHIKPIKQCVKKDEQIICNQSKYLKNPPVYKVCCLLRFRLCSVKTTRWITPFTWAHKVISFIFVVFSLKKDFQGLNFKLSNNINNNLEIINNYLGSNGFNFNFFSGIKIRDDESRYLANKAFWSAADYKCQLNV